MVNNIDYSNFENKIRNLYEETGEVSVTLGYKSYIVKATLEKDKKGNILIGNYCSISHDVVFVIGQNHEFDKVTTYPENLIGSSVINEEERADLPEKSMKKKANSYQISIGHDVWVGRGVTILSGVKIGNGAIIGAQAVVAKDVPPYAVVVGNPGTVIKYRFDEKTIHELQYIKWWYWEEQRIVENRELMKDTSAFVSKFYSPGLEDLIQNETSAYLRKLHDSGTIIIYFSPDFGWTKSVWQNVIKQYLERYTGTDKAVLILELQDEEKYKEAVTTIYKWIDSYGADAPLMIKNNSQKKLPLDILQNIDIFITTRAYESIQCIDYAFDYDVKVLSGLDDVIFA